LAVSTLSSLRIFAICIGSFPAIHKSKIRFTTAAVSSSTIHCFLSVGLRANSRKEVDELYLRIKEIGANIIYTPRIFEEHGPYYDAMFFKDLEGIKYEIVFNKPESEVF
jgi:predicted lactoylglutathione lyase